MEKDELRFSISAENYLEKHSVLVYIEDAVSQLLEHKEDNPKVNTSKFLSEYFVSVREGNHTLFREYAFIQATPHNRRSFVKTLWKCFRNIGQKGDLLSIKEYHSLLCLLCADFPFIPVQKTAKIILMDDAMDCLISFSDFLYAFQVQFCFDDFLTKCVEVYKDLELTKQNSHDPVVVPTSEEATPRIHEDDVSNKLDGVDSTTFLRALMPITELMGFSAPPLPVLRHIFSSAERVTYYGFLMALAKSESLNSAIGNLPHKGELFDTSEKELTSLFRSRTAVQPGSAKARQTVDAKSTNQPLAPLTRTPGNLTDSTSQPTSQTATLQRAPSSLTDTSKQHPGSKTGMKSQRLANRMARQAVSSGESEEEETDESDDTN